MSGSAAPTVTVRLRVVPAEGPALVVARGEVVLLPDSHLPLVPALAGRARTGLAALELDGRRIDRRSPARRVRAGFAAVVGSPVAPDVSVTDHLAAAVGPRRAATLLAATPLLAGRGDDPAGVLSGGERRVLAWLLADATDPRAVLLDRAGTGLDAAALAWAHARLDAWLDRGAAVLVVAGRAEEGGLVTHRADGSPR